MARQPTHSPLNVFLNDRLVGHLRRQSNGAVDFRYHADWLAWDHAMPISWSLLLRDTSFLVSPMPAHAFFKQPVLKRQIRHAFLQITRLMP